MSDPITLDRQIAAVRQEIGMRRHVYPRFVSSGKLTQQKADAQIAAMEAVQATLEQLRDELRAKAAPGLFGEQESTMT